MVAWVFIIMLALLSFSTIMLLIFTAKKHSNEIMDLMYMYNSLRERNNETNEKISEINTSWSKSLDDREKSYNDIYLKCKKLEIELGEREAEIIKLQTKLYSINQSMHDALTVDTSKGPDSEVQNEKEEAKKEN